MSCSLTLFHQNKKFIYFPFPFSDWGQKSRDSDLKAAHPPTSPSTPSKLFIIFNLPGQHPERTALCVSAGSSTRIPASPLSLPQVMISPKSDPLV